MRRLLSILLAILAVAGSVPGPAMAQDPIQVHDGATYWQGQTLTRSDEVPNGATVSVRATTHQFYHEYTAGRGGTVTFDTSDYKAGTYSLRVQGDEIARFHVEVQSLQIATAGVNRDTGHADFDIKTPRAEFDLVVNSSSLSTTELEHAFGNYTTTEADVDGDSRDELVVRDVRRSRQLTGDFADHRDTHTLRFDVLDTGAAAKATVSVGWPNYQQVALLDDRIVDHRGDIVPLRIALPDTDSARLNLGSEQVHYVVNASVSDTDGDNRVTVYLHTEAMGQAGRTLSADGGSVAVRNETELSGQIDTAEYPVSVVDGNGNNDDLATLALERGESKRALSYTYPKGDHPESLLAVRDGSRDRTVVDNESIALVYEVSGVYSSLEDASADDLADGVDGIRLEVAGERKMNANRRPSLDVGDGSLYIRPDEETLAVVLDTSDVQAAPDSTYNATLSFEGRDLENLTTAFTVQAPDASFESPMPPAQTLIRGETVYETGSTVSVGIYARGGNIQQSRTVDVAENGRFQAPIDLRALAGESIHVRLKDGTEWREIPVREGVSMTTTTTTTTTQTTTTPATTRQTSTARETTTTAQATATPPTTTATTTTAAGNTTVETAVGVPDPENGLLSGLSSILGFGVVVIGGALVLVNRIAD